MQNGGQNVLKSVFILQRPQSCPGCTKQLTREILTPQNDFESSALQIKEKLHPFILNPCHATIPGVIRMKRTRGASLVFSDQ